MKSYALRAVWSLALVACLAALSTVAIAPLPILAASRPDGPQQDQSTSSQPSTSTPADPASGKQCTQQPADSVKRMDPAAWQHYLKTANRHATIGAQLASRALTYRGVPYVFGGTSMHGIDCSALTQAVYRKWGMMLPRTSTEQFHRGIPVPRAQLKPGDLVFFANTYKRGVSHVGIYVGNGKILHAAGRRKGVIVSSLGEPYLDHHYAGARRIALDKEPAHAAPPVDESMPVYATE